MKVHLTREHLDAFRLTEAVLKEINADWYVIEHCDIVTTKRAQLEDAQNARYYSHERRHTVTGMSSPFNTPFEAAYVTWQHKKGGGRFPRSFELKVPKAFSPCRVTVDFEASKYWRLHIHSIDQDGKEASEPEVRDVPRNH